jgi:hypothetical protein
VNTHAHGRSTLSSSSNWKVLLDIGNAHQGCAWRVRVRGASADYRVVVSGACGDEVMLDGTLPSTDTLVSAVVVEGVPGGTRIRVEARASSGEVRAELSWRPTFEGATFFEPGAGAT